MAGTVDMFDIFRLLGEHLLIRKGIQTPFLYAGGSAHMQESLAICKRDLKRIGELIQNEGLSVSIPPFKIGVSDKGAFSLGALELNMVTLERIE